MKIYWKTFGGTCIHRTPNDISVHQNYVYRWLSFKDPNTVQTLINRHHPHKPGLPYLAPLTLALRAQPGPTCLLGLGGGAVPHLAAPHLNSHPITAVEANAVVIEIAAKYFMTDTLKNLNIVHQDAYEFISKCQTQYQHLLIDIYTDAGFPVSCNHLDFFSTCKQRLLPQGVLALNVVNMQKEFKLFEHLRTVFGQATLCFPFSRATNVIVLASDSSNQLLSLVKHVIWDSYYGYIGKL